MQGRTVAVPGMWVGATKSLWNLLGKGEGWKRSWVQRKGFGHGKGPGASASRAFFSEARSLSGDQRFMSSKNSSLVFVFFILSRMNSIASISSMS